MYLVELRPGKEELYRSTDALALAIRNGDVDERSRIYHRATAKWISITLHPQYRAIVAAAKDESPRPTRRGWSILGGSSDNSPQARAGEVQSSAANTMYRWRRPLALGLAGFLLQTGLQLAFSAPRPAWEAHRRANTVAVKAAEPVTTLVPTKVSDESGLVTLASNRSAWTESTVDNSYPVEHSRIESSIAVPRAPKLAATLLNEDLAPKKADAKSLDALFTRYDAAHDAAESRLEAGMRVARLGRLFDSSHLTPNGGVTDTRMSLAGAANFIRVFRQQQTVIERAYRDSVTRLARDNGWPAYEVRKWYARPPRKESPALELISGTLLATIDSVLGVLDAQAGAYKIRGGTIAFEDRAARQAYAALRRRITDQINAAVAAGGSTSPGPAGLLLQAIGTTSLPRET